MSVFAGFGPDGTDPPPLSRRHSSPDRTMSAAQFHETFASLKARVDEDLQQRMQTAAWPAALRDAVEYSLLAGGKRLRPALVLIACEVCGGDPQTALPAAAGIEMIHTYSLIHDDLPSMDDDDLRRGRATSHIVFGEALAILAGDALLTFAFETLGTASTPPGITADCLTVLSRAAGGVGMVGGQILDLAAEGALYRGRTAAGEAEFASFQRSREALSAVGSGESGGESDNPTSDDGSIRVEQLIQIHRMKTGALITAALELGASVGGGTWQQRQALVEYGHSIGLAFQIADDLLDVTGNNEKLGKETGRDDELGKLTYPSLIGIESSRRKAEALVEAACSALDVFGTGADVLRQLARFIVERDH